MVDYVRAATTAHTQINKNGREITVIKPADRRKEWEPWAGDDESESDEYATKITVKGVFADSRTLGEQYNLTDLPDGQKMCLVSALSVGDNKLEEFSGVQDGDTRWAIKGVKVLEPGTVRIMYILGLTL